MQREQEKDREANRQTREASEADRQHSGAVARGQQTAFVDRGLPGTAGGTDDAGTGRFNRDVWVRRSWRGTVRACPLVLWPARYCPHVPAGERRLPQSCRGGRGTSRRKVR